MIDLTPHLSAVIAAYKDAQAAKRVVQDTPVRADSIAEDALLDALELAYGKPPWRRQAWTCEGYAVVYQGRRSVGKSAFTVAPLSAILVKELELK